MKLPVEMLGRVGSNRATDTADMDMSHGMPLTWLALPSEFG